MENTKMAFIFQIYYATPIIRLLISEISDLKVTCNYLGDLNEILYGYQLEDGEYRCDNYFSKFLCHAPNQAITQGNKVTCNQLSDLYETLYSNQLEDSYTKMALIFQIYYATPIIRLLIRVISDLKVTCNYLTDLNEISYIDQLKDG